MKMTVIWKDETIKPKTKLNLKMVTFQLRIWLKCRQTSRYIHVYMRFSEYGNISSEATWREEEIKFQFCPN